MRWMRITLTTTLLLFVVVSLAKAVLATVTPPAVVEAAPEPKATAPIIAYYFHATKRCVTCRQIEENGQKSFAHAVQAGRVEWRVANYEEPANAHFAKEFDIAFSNIVLVTAGESTPRRWMVLDKAWELYDEPAAFAQYTEAELQAFEGGQR
jgi:hypothetical protein